MRRECAGRDCDYTVGLLPQSRYSAARLRHNVRNNVTARDYVITLPRDDSHCTAAERNRSDFSLRNEGSRLVWCIVLAFNNPTNLVPPSPPPPYPSPSARTNVGFRFFCAQYAGIRIGPVVKKDVMKASIMLEHDSQWVQPLDYRLSYNIVVTVTSRCISVRLRLNRSWLQYKTVAHVYVTCLSWYSAASLRSFPA